MALIECPGCGKEISDKATKCPQCGFEFKAALPEKDNQNETLVCEECGKEFFSCEEACPFCGCPVTTPINEASNVSISEDPSAQAGVQQGDNKNDSKGRKPNKKGIVVLGILILAVICVFSAVQIKKRDNEKKLKARIEAEEKAKKERIDNAPGVISEGNDYCFKHNSLVISEMLIWAASAEECGNLIRDVWYNTIFDKSDSKTDKYTSGHDDFNDSLADLFDDADFQEDLEGIQSGRQAVSEKMRKLQNHSAEFDEVYQDIDRLYDAFNTLTNMAIDPQGSLESYTEDFREADTAFSTAYDRCKDYKYSSDASPLQDDKMEEVGGRSYVNEDIDGYKYNIYFSPNLLYCSYVIGDNDDTEAENQVCDENWYILNDKMYFTNFEPQNDRDGNIYEFDYEIANDKLILKDGIIYNRSGEYKKDYRNKKLIFESTGDDA